MPQPTVDDVHVNTALGMVALGYKQTLDMLISGKAFPEVPVQKRSDAIFEFDKEFWMRNIAGVRSAGTESRGGGFKLSSDKTYYCKNHAVHFDLPKDVVENADLQSLETSATEFVTWQIYMDRELDWVAQYFTDPDTGHGTTWWNVKTGKSSGPSTDEFLQWNDTSSTPVANIREYMREIQKKTGFRPNKLILGPEVMDELQLNSAVQAYVAYAPTARADIKPLITPELLAMILGLDEVLVGEMSYTSSAEGASSITYNFAFGKNALLVYTPPKPGIMTPSGGYNFTWSRMGRYNPEVSKWWKQDIKSTRIEAEAYYDHKLVGPQLGIFMADCVA